MKRFFILFMLIACFAHAEDTTGFQELKDGIVQKEANTFITDGNVYKSKVIKAEDKGWFMLRKAYSVIDIDSDQQGKIYVDNVKEYYMDGDTMCINCGKNGGIFLKGIYYANYKKD